MLCRRRGWCRLANVGVANVGVAHVGVANVGVANVGVFAPRLGHSPPL